MRKIFTLLMIVCFSIQFTIPVKALEIQVVEATAYCDQGFTATQTVAREGIVAFAPKYYGRTVGIWDNGQFLGWFTVEDTGSSKIRNGECIDIWMPEYEQCRQFGRHDVMIQIL